MKEILKVPEIIRAERDLAGSIIIRFFKKSTPASESPADAEKSPPYDEIAFSEIRGGIAWPLRGMNAYLCLIGLKAGAQVGVEGSMMLIYEKEFATSKDLMTDAYNRAGDYRFTRFFSDLKFSDWLSFNAEFQRQVRHGLGAQHIRLEHSHFAHDFLMGIETISRFGKSGALILQKDSIITQELHRVKPDTLEIDRPELQFNKINALRYVLVSYDRIKALPKYQAEQDRKISVSGWS